MVQVGRLRGGRAILHLRPDDEEGRTQGAGENGVMPLTVTRKFDGLYDTENSKPDLQGLAGRFDFIRARPDARVRYTTTEHVIRDKDGFGHFVDRVPKRKMQCVPDPEASNDPILQRPEIDFETHMLLAIVSHEPNRFIALDIEGVELTEGSMRVLYDFAEPGPLESKVIAYGCYCAVVVPRFDGEIVFARREKS